MSTPADTTKPDPIAILRRLAAIRGAGLSVPRDLSREVVDWISGAAGSILAGSPVADALGLAVHPGGRSVARKVQQFRRDTLLASLLTTATGSLNQRADAALAWIEGADPVPVEAQPIVAAVQTCGLPVPGDVRGIQRAAARAARAGAVNPAADCATVSPEGAAIAAHEHRA